MSTTVGNGSSRVQSVDRTLRCSDHVQGCPLVASRKPVVAGWHGFRSAPSERDREAAGDGWLEDAESFGDGGCFFAVESEGVEAAGGVEDVTTARVGKDDD